MVEFGKAEWVIVEPIIEIGKTYLYPQQMVIQSLLSRCIGKIGRWKEFFSAQAKIGYNAFHLTPIQELGISGSLYCLRDQLKLSSEIFSGKNVSHVV